MGFRIQRLRGDRGKEYKAGYFQKYFLDIGIRQQFTSTNTPQYDGVSERDGRTLTEMARCLLSDGGFSKSLWGEMFFTAAFPANRAPHKVLENETPYKRMHGRDANLRMLRAIGARAFVHVEIHTQKMDAKAWEGKLCGYSTDSRAYRVYIPTTKRVTESRNVTFIETSPHNVTNVVDDFYLQDVYNCTSSLNPPSTTIDTTDSNSDRKELLQRVGKISNDGSIRTSSNHDPEPAGGSESSRPSTRSRIAGGMDNQSNAPKRMSTRASSLVETSLLWISAALTTDS